MRAASSELRRDARRRDDLLVSHGISRALDLLDALGLGPDRLWSLQASPTGISELEFRPDWTALHRMNTLAHLERAWTEECGTREDLSRRSCPKGAKIYLPDEAARKRAWRSASSASSGAGAIARS